MVTETRSPTVLVTGASGFIATHCILQLLEQGYRVRGTLRTPSHETTLRQLFARHVGADNQLEFAEADLLKEDGWREAVRGCEYILHLASPLPAGPPKDENELIVPARDGTLRVLKAAASEGVKRVVLTSSISAMATGHMEDCIQYDESDWSITDGMADAYAKSKTLAERAAWDFANNLQPGHPLELAVINPATVLGPVLDAHFKGKSGELVRRLLCHAYPGCARLCFPLVDVRDVAAAHLLAMTVPDAAGKRFCCVSETLWMVEIALILDKHYASRGYRIPTRVLPDFFFRAVALFDKTARLVTYGLGKQCAISNDQIVNVLGWQPRKAEEMIIDMAESMIRHGIV